MKPTAITLEIVPSSPSMKKFAPTTARLRVTMPDSLQGFTIIESAPMLTGKSLPKFRKQAAAYAARFGIAFTDQTA